MTPTPHPSVIRSWSFYPSIRSRLISICCSSCISIIHGGTNFKQPHAQEFYKSRMHFSSVKILYREPLEIPVISQMANWTIFFQYIMQFSPLTSSDGVERPPRFFIVSMHVLPDLKRWYHHYNIKQGPRGELGYRYTNFVETYRCVTPRDTQHVVVGKQSYLQLANVLPATIRVASARRVAVLHLDLCAISCVQSEWRHRLEDWKWMYQSGILFLNNPTS